MPGIIVSRTQIDALSPEATLFPTLDADPGGPGFPASDAAGGAADAGAVDAAVVEDGGPGDDDPDCEEGLACNDGDPCTVDDTCVGGRCGGKCGVCEFRKVCGGSRSRAYGVYGDPFAEDPSCVYIPKKYQSHNPN